MLDRIGETTPALRGSAERGVPHPVLQVSGLQHVSHQPQEPVVVDLLAQDREHDLVVEAPKQSAMSPSMNQVVPVQVLATSRQRGVAAPAGTETVGAVGEPRLVVRLQQEADHFADELVRPGRQPERACLPILLRDVDPLAGLEPVALVAHRIDDASDLLQRHAVHGFPVDPGRHRSMVGVDTPVGQQIQLRVEQLSIQLIARQATPAAFTEDTQYRFGVLHYAYLPALRCPITWPPSPCGRLSRPPWQVVTPATTTGPPSP